MTDSYGGKTRQAAFGKRPNSTRIRGCTTTRYCLYQNILAREPAIEKHRQNSSGSVRKENGRDYGFQVRRHRRAFARLVLDLGVAYMEMGLYAEALDDSRRR